MSLVFFGIGFIIFSIYLILLVWNIIYNGNKQEEENYPNLDYDKFNDVDMDGIGNQGRVPNIRKRKIINSFHWCTMDFNNLFIQSKESEQNQWKINS